MKRLISLILITAVLLTIVYADATGEQIAEDKDTDGSFHYRYVTHAEGKTYVIYNDTDFAKVDHYYLATLNNGKLKNMGEIDEMIGGNNEDTTITVGRRTIDDRDYYIVTGMAQIDGTVYIAKKRHIYRLEEDELVEIPITFDGKRFDVARTDLVINKLSVNSDSMFIVVNVKGEFIVAAPEEALDSRWDAALLKVDTNGNMIITGKRIPSMNSLRPNSWLQNPAQFSVNDSEDMFGYSSSSHSYGFGVYSMDKELPDKLLDKTGWPIFNKIIPEFNNMIYVGDQLYSYSGKKEFVTKLGNEFNASTSIEKITLGEYVAFRPSVYQSEYGAYQCTTNSVGVVKGPNVILQWSMGDDGYLYMIGGKTSESNDSIIDYTNIYRIKL